MRVRQRLLPLVAFAAALVRGDLLSDTLASNASSFSSPHRQLALSCSIQTGVDFKGNDIANIPAVAASDCCAKCSAQTGCGAFTWTNYNGGTCWLKSSKGSTVASNTNAQSAEVSSTGASCSIESGIDYVNNDIGNVVATTATDCCAMCSQRSGCGAFTWTNYNGGTCWLKSGKGMTKANPNAYSSVVDGANGLCSAPEQNVDYNGADVGNIAGSGASDCCSKCGARSDCRAFTWTNYNGGTCWLKGGKGSVVAKSGAVSAVIVTSTTTPPTTAPPTTAPPTPPSHIQPRLRSGEIPLRSVNLGSWLVAEYWMSFTSPAWTDTNGVGWDGEYVTMQKLGKDKGTKQFEEHRATWLTETDIAQIAAAGMNAVRVPVGFWIVNDDPSTVASDISRVYAAGSLKYLDKLMNDWAIKYNLAVMISLHAHQGSQNGYDHSAPQVKGKTTWSDSQANVDSSLQLATFLAARYKDSVAFLGMNLMNEPSYPTDYNVLWAYYKEAYKRIRATGNDCVLVTSPMLQEQGPPVMMDFMRWPTYYNVWHEFHTYYKWGWEGVSETEVMNAARQYRATHLDNWTGNWIFMGEWSLAHTDDAPFTDRNLLKEFAAVQMKNFEGAHSGWAFWSWRHDDEWQELSVWSLRQLLREGILTVPRVN